MSLPDDHPYLNPKTIAQHAAAYRLLGCQVMPVHDKVPVLPWKEFQDAIMGQEVFDGLYGPAGRFIARPDTGMGMITGKASGGIIMLDLDTYKPGGEAATRWLNGVVEVHNCGFDLETWEQTTGRGGRQLFFKCPDLWMISNASTDLNIDLRGQGGYTVVPPSKGYGWLPGRAPWEIKILVAPPWLCDEIERLVAEHGGVVRGVPVSRPEYNGPTKTTFGTAVIDGRERYMRDLVWAAMSGLRMEDNPIRPGEAEMMVVWPDYVRNVRVQEPRPGESHEDGLEREGRGLTVFRQKWKHAASKWDNEVAEAAKARKEREPPKASEPPPEQPKQPPDLIPLHSAFPIEEAKIPVRDWIIPYLLLKRAVTMLVAPPGHGKSLLTLQLGIMVAMSIEWGGWMPRKPEKVLVINAEDDLDEMRRRLCASATEMKVSHGALANRLMLAETPENIVIAKRDSRTKSIVRTPLIENLVATVIHHNIGFLIVDPFAETFEADESNNSEVKWAGILWREVARRTGCALILVHHTKKYASAMAGDADASRGGGSMIGIARTLCTLFNMTEEEALAMNVSVEDRNSYVRFDDGKMNYGKLGLVRWFEKKTVTLANGTGFVPGDDVGVLAPWRPPGALDGVTEHDIGLALDAIDRGLLDENGKSTGQYYTVKSHNQSKERWAGKVLTRMLGCSDAAARTLIKKWLKEDVLIEFEYADPMQRKARTGVKSVAKNRPYGAAQHSNL